MIVYFKALCVVSLRRPTVAFLLKPFMLCRSDARLWHACYLFHNIFYTSMILHIHILYELPACVHHGFCLFRD